MFTVALPTPIKVSALLVLFQRDMVSKVQLKLSYPGKISMSLFKEILECLYGSFLCQYILKEYNIQD